MSEPQVVIRCRENGPLVIKGPIQLVDHQGNAYTLPTDKDQVALCRCGHSSRKPFCDGTHRAENFQAAELAPPPAAETT